MLSSLVPAADAADAVMVMGMPLPLALALVSLVSVVLTAAVPAMMKKFRTPVDDREDKVVVLDASDRLIQRFEQLLNDSDAKHGKEIKELKGQIEDLGKQVDELKQDRSGLIWALRQVYTIAKKYGGREAERELALVDIPASASVH